MLSGRRDRCDAEEVIDHKRCMSATGKCKRCQECEQM